MVIFLLITILFISSFLDIKQEIVYSPFNICIVLLGFVKHISGFYDCLDIVLGYVFIPIILLILNVYKKDSIGYGDIEFISAMGIFLGYKKLVYAFFISVIFLFIYSRIVKKERYPFIPFLSIGFVIVLIFNQYNLLQL